MREQLATLVTESSNLEVKRVRRRAAQAKAVGGWTPLKYRLLALFARTLECPHAPAYEVEHPPTLVGKNFKKGKLRYEGNAPVQVWHPDCPCHHGKFGCGWPLQQFSSPGWRADANAALREYEGLLAETFQSSRREFNYHTYRYEVKKYEVILNSQHLKDGTSLHTLVTCLKACVASGIGAECKCVEGLQPKFIFRLRDTLASWNSTRGLPRSPTFKLYRARGKEQNAVRVTDFVPELDAHFKGCVQERGLAHQKAVLGNVKLRGAERPVPESLKMKIRRAREGTLGDLVARRLITSSEMLAALVPGLTSEVASIGLNSARADRCCCSTSSTR